MSTIRYFIHMKKMYLKKPTLLHLIQSYDHFRVTYLEVYCTLTHNIGQNMPDGCDDFDFQCNVNFLP